MTNSLSWVLPLFNEKEYVSRTLPKTVEVLESLSSDYEIIVVDDASTDGSPGLVREFALQNSRIRLLCHDRNRGLGAALRSGFSAARKDIVIYSDFDMPFDFSIVKDLIPFMNEADIVHGYRVGSRESLKRVIYSFGYNFLVKRSFRVDIRDINFSLDIIRREALGRLRLRSEASFVATELLTKAAHLGYRIRQVPVLYVPRMFGRSRLSSVVNIGKILFEFGKYYPEILSFKRRGVSAKNLIVSADDFGLTGGVNRGIMRAFREGLVTSASILATGKAFGEAVQLARENDRLDIGVHLCLTEETPVSAASRIPTLTGPDGRFFAGWKQVLMRLALGRIHPEEVEAELEAQIRKVLEAGIVPTHIDSHQHIHLLPPVLKIVIALAKKYQIRHIRCPDENWLTGHASSILSWRKFLLWAPLHLAKKEIKRHGLTRTDHFFGSSSSGKLGVEMLELYLKNLRDGVTEIVCHPGEDMGAGDYRHWGYAWSREADALTDTGIKRTTDKCGIRLVNYKTAYGA